MNQKKHIAYLRKWKNIWTTIAFAALITCLAAIIVMSLTMDKLIERNEATNRLLLTGVGLYQTCLDNSNFTNEEIGEIYLDREIEKIKEKNK